MEDMFELYEVTITDKIQTTVRSTE